MGGMCTIEVGCESLYLTKVSQGLTTKHKARRDIYGKQP
jgi:hypothetical protein